MLKKDIHYSTELEQAILGSFLIEKTAFGRCYGLLTSDLFYHESHQTLFNCISEMWQDNIPVDLISVHLKLLQNGTELLEGFNTGYFLAKITRDVVSTASLEYHSVLLKQMYFEREIINITHGGLNGKESFEAANIIQDRIMKLRQINLKEDFKTMDQVILSLVAHMDKVKNQDLAGITTGFKQLDKITGGFTPGGLFILAARPSVGKSAFMGKMVLGAAMAKKNVGVISLEMADEQITARLSSIVTDIEFWRIYRSRMQDQDQAVYFYAKINEMAHLPILISDTTVVNIEEIKAKIARLKQKGKIDILFIDYLQLIDTQGNNRNSNREQEVSKISRGLKLTAMEYGIPIVVLAQLNRESEKATDKKPKLHNLRESGSLEQDADGVMFIHRDWMVGTKINENGISTENEADIIIAKWRNGELTEYKIGFDGAKMKFYEFENAPF